MQSHVGMLNISDGVDVAIHHANYKLVHYCLVKGLCKNITINMKSLLNNACRCGEYDLAVWIMQNIEHSDLDLSSAFINACNYGSTKQFPVANINDDFLAVAFNNIGNIKYSRGLWCAMLIADKIDNRHSLDFEAALSIASKTGNNRMGQWLQYIFQSGR